MHPGLPYQSRAREAAALRLEGMTLIEVIVVIAILAFAGAGLSFSLGALTKTNLKSAAGKLASASRFAFMRATIRGTTVRISFDLPGDSFSIEEGHGRVTLTRKDDARRKESEKEDGEDPVAVDPWVAARNRVEQAVKPTYGASPFSAITGEDGKVLTRYQNVKLGRRVQLVKLIVPHAPEPIEQGKGAVHFFPAGMTEHAVIQLSDGADAIYSVEIHPLTGRARIYPNAYEPKQLFGDPDHPDVSEVEP
jgi:prepilin-type N-terminal cleavage/methylation domain-containing protein